jgi:high affinity sulfate transporter 1
MAKIEAESNTAHWLLDLVAGLSVAGLLVPEAVAYSGIAGLPPQYGIIALLAGLTCYGLLGQSRFAIVSATSSSAAVLAAATATLAGGNPGHQLALAAGLILFTGVFFLAAGLARMGAISDFIAKPVLRGFTFGLALVIIIKQLPKIVGVQAHHSDIIRYALDLVRQFSHWNPEGGLVGLVALVLLFLLKPYRRVPSSLLVIVLGIAAQALWGLDQHGVTLVGTIHLSFHGPSAPELTRVEWFRLGELAFAMVFVLYAESYGSIRTFALKYGDPVTPDRELLGLGLANLAAGFFGGMPVGAGYSATSANEAAGARTKRAAWIAALVVLALVIALLPFLALIPEPVLAAIVIYAVTHTLNPALIRIYFRWGRDRIVALVAIAAVLVLGIMDGLLLAVGVSLLMTLRDLSQPKVSILGRLGEGHDFVNIVAHPEAKPIPGLLIMRPEAPLFFANVDRILTLVRTQIVNKNEPAKALILSLEETSDLDGTCVEALTELVQFTNSRGIKLLFARLHDSVRAVLTRAAIPNLPTLALTNWSVDDAVTMALSELRAI